MNRRTGITLIETLVALAISSFLMLGLVTVFTQTRGVYRAAERIARLHENLRFSQAMIREDVRLADFWGRTHRAENLATSSGVRVTCRKRDVTRWALDVSQAVEINDESYALPCPGTRPSEKSDVLVIRHASAATTTAKAGATQIQSNGARGIIFSDSANVLKSQPGSKIFDLVVNAYYVSNRSNHDAELPALRRLTLVHGVMQDQEIISGISNLQVQLGLDTDGDNRADTYVDGDHISLGRPENHVVAVRLQLAAQSKNPAEPQAVVTQTVFLRNARRAAHLSGPT
jgi:type IV pilus assembly protein PilW